MASEVLAMTALGHERYCEACLEKICFLVRKPTPKNAVLQGWGEATAGRHLRLGKDLEPRLQPC